MTKDELIELEVTFTDEWYKEHTGVPTYADAIEWSIKNPPKGTSPIKWHTGTPKIGGEYLVCLKNGSVLTDKFLAVDGLEGDWKRFNKSYVVAWCKLSDIEPYKEE